jgi:uncharacterized caspase-like protein
MSVNTLIPYLLRDGMDSGSWQVSAFFLILFISGMISFPAAAAGDPLRDAGQRWAVIIGISDYQNLGDLDNSVNDALDMKSVLINNCNFAADHVYTYTNAQASKGSIQNALSLMSARAGPSDTVLFYFSGHGDQMDRDLYPFDEADGMDEVLCPYDSYSDSYDRDISDDELQTWLGRINSKNTICIFDTCNSGGMVKGSRISAIYGASKDSPAVEAFIRNDGFSEDLLKDARSSKYVMLMASDDDESAVDSSRLQNGVFTYYLVEGLTSASANTDSDRYISIEEAFSYAQAASTRYDSRMHPQIYDGDPNTEIELSFLSATPTPTATQSTPAVDITGKTAQGYISSGQSQYYYFDIPSGVSQGLCTVTLTGPSGSDFDLYIRKGATPTKDDYDYRGYTSTANEQVSISSPSSGRYYVMVQAYSGSGSFTLTETTGGSTTQTITPTPTITGSPVPTTSPIPTVTQSTSGTDITGKTVTGYISSGQSQYYYFDIPVGSAVSSCTVMLDGPPGADYDLFLKRGSIPGTWIYDYRSAGRTADESITINNPSAGRYYVMVKFYSGPGSYTIRETHSAGATITPTPSVVVTTVPMTTFPTTSPLPTVTQSTSGTDITGKTVTGYISPGQSQYYYFDIPVGLAVSSCTVMLDGPPGADYDLFVKRGSNPGTWIYDYRSAGRTADESITINNPSSGRYYVMIKAYSGSGPYTLSETTSGGGILTGTPTPTITGSPIPTTSPLPTVTQSTSGTDITGRTVTGYISSGQSQYYYFDIPVGSAVSSCMVMLDGPPGADYDLFVKRGSIPGTWIYDYRSAGRTADESVTINYPSAGRYYVMVKFYSGPGSYTLRETHSGIVNQTASPTVTSTWVVPTTMPITVSPTLTSTPADGTGYGSIAVTSSPTSAWIYLDGVPARKITPSTLTVTAGTHTLGCRKTGYPEQVRTVTVVSGMTADVHFTL